MPISARKKAVTNTDPNDEERLLETIVARWDKLLYVEVHCRAGRTGRWGDTGWAFERLTKEELDDPSMPDDTPDDMCAKLFDFMRAFREQNGPHVFQLRSFMADRTGEAKHDRTGDISVSMLESAADFGSHKESLAEARTSNEATTLGQLHRMYLDMGKANLELVKAVTASPLVTGQAEIRKAELEHEVAMFDKKSEREDDQEVWEIGKHLLYAKLGMGSDPSAANTNPEACDFAQRFATLVGDKAEEFATIVAPEDVKGFLALIGGASNAKTDQDFRRFFQEIRERFELYSPEEAKVIVGKLAKEVGMMQMLEFKELISDVFEG